MVDCWLSAQAAFSSGRLPSLPLFPSLCVPQFLVHHFSQRRYGSLSLSLSELDPTARRPTMLVGGWNDGCCIAVGEATKEGRKEGEASLRERATGQGRRGGKASKGTNRNARSKILKNGLSFFCQNDRGTHTQPNLNAMAMEVYCTHIIQTLIAPIYEFPHQQMFKIEGGLYLSSVTPISAHRQMRTNISGIEGILIKPQVQETGTSNSPWQHCELEQERERERKRVREREGAAPSPRPYQSPEDAVAAPSPSRPCREALRTRCLRLSHAREEGVR